MLDTGQVNVHFQAKHDADLNQVASATVEMGILTCNVPHSLPPGAYLVHASLSHPVGMRMAHLSAPCPDLFDVVPPPRFLHVSPAFGPACGGTLLRIGVAPEAVGTFRDTGDISVNFTSLFGNRLVGEVSQTTSPRSLPYPTPPDPMSPLPQGAGLVR